MSSYAFGNIICIFNELHESEANDDMQKYQERIILAYIMVYYKLHNIIITNFTFFLAIPLARMCQILEYDQIIKPEFVSFEVD